MKYDQCQQCATRETCMEIRNYDGTSCPNYRKADAQQNSGDEVSDNDFENTDFSGHNGYTPAEGKITPEHLKATTNIHGWLVFFFVAILLGSVASLIFCIVEYAGDTSTDSIYSFLDMVESILALVVAVSTVVAFVQRRTDAVFLGKMYVIYVLASNVLLIFLGDFEDVGLGSIKQLVRSTIWSIIWLCYLIFSEQVAEVIPKSYRRATTFSKWLLGLLIALPVLAFAIGMGSAYNEHDDSEEYVELVADDDEYTDGYMAFRVPDGFSCTEDGDGYDRTFYLNKDSSISVIIFGSTTVDDLTNEQLFDTIFAMRCESDEELAELDDFPNQILDQGTTNVNGNRTFHKVKRWQLDEDFYYYYRLYMIFDSETDKSCLIECEDLGNDDYLPELMLSVRFQ